MTCYYINFPQKFLLLEEQVTEDKTTCIDNKNAISEDSHVGNGSTEYSHVVNCKNTESHDPEGEMRIVIPAIPHRANGSNGDHHW